MLWKYRVTPRVLASWSYNTLKVTRASFSTIYTRVTSVTAMCWPLTDIEVPYVPSSPEPGLLSKQHPGQANVVFPSLNGQSPESAAHCVLGHALSHRTLPVTTFATNLRLIFACISLYNIVSSSSIPLAFTPCLVLALSPCSVQQAEQGCCRTLHLPVQGCFGWQKSPVWQVW